MNFLFDVDGTLTPPRKPMKDSFKNYFGQWVNSVQKAGHKAFLVTGSDKHKTIEQIGLPLYRLLDGCYQSCGNELYIRDRLVKYSQWKMSANLHLDILEVLEKSKWYGRAENNIEERVGMINISAVGRSASNVLRKEYYTWDKATGERLDIVNQLSYKYPDLFFSIGGEISIDIYPKGKDKSQILKDMTGECIFFGDKCSKGGNDFEISTMVKRSYNVSDWKQTEEILRAFSLSNEI